MPLIHYFSFRETRYISVTKTLKMKRLYGEMNALGTVSYFNPTIIKIVIDVCTRQPKVSYWI